jgi:hypothetical protein
VALQRLLTLAEADELTPTHPDFLAHTGLPRAQLTPAVNDALVRMWLQPSYLRTAISEAGHVGGSTPGEEIAEASFGDLPIVVLSGGRIDPTAFNGGDPRRAAAWRAMQEDIAALSSRSSLRTLDCGHNIPIEAPGAVVAAIQALI